MRGFEDHLSQLKTLCCRIEIVSGQTVAPRHADQPGRRTWGQGLHPPVGLAEPSRAERPAGTGAPFSLTRQSKYAWGYPKTSELYPSMAKFRETEMEASPLC